jgi:peptide/nickel transport system permease protein
LGRYFKKKSTIYLITLFVAITINWLIPRLMPGDPISILMSRLGGLESGRDHLESFFRKSFGLDQAWYVQYFNYWKSILSGDLGVSIYLYPKRVMDVISSAAIYDLLLMIPAISLSWIVGNKIGAISASHKKLDNALMPFFYFLCSAPYFWFAVVLAWFFGVVLDAFPLQGATSSYMIPHFSLAFILDYLHHWILPFLSLFGIMIGQWAIGMRNMIIYEMGSNYSGYMEAQGSSAGLIRRYAFRNAVLPQVTGLAIRLGQFITGALAMEIVFSYPGLGYNLYKAIINQDYFLVQGCFLFIVIFMLAANFLVDIIYMVIDPRVRYSYSGEGA